MFYLASAFALSMIPEHAHISVDRIDHEIGPDMGQYLVDRDIKSVVGHESTASLMSAKLGIPVAVNREQVKVNYGDSIYVCQVMTRLQEGQVLSLEELKAVPVAFYVVTVMRQ